MCHIKSVSGDTDGCHPRQPYGHVVGQTPWWWIETMGLVEKDEEPGYYTVLFKEVGGGWVMKHKHTTGNATVESKQ